MLKTITVRELIERLEDEDPDAKVVFSADYGDHHHTAQALPIRGDVEEVEVTKTAYSNSGYAIVDDADESVAPPDGETYVVIR